MCLIRLTKAFTMPLIAFLAVSSPAPLFAEWGRHDASIGGQPFPLQSQLRIVPPQQDRPCLLRLARLTPLREPAVDRGFGAEPAGQLTPLAAGARQPDLTIEHGAVRAARTTRFRARLLTEQERFQFGPQEVIDLLQRGVVILVIGVRGEHRRGGKRGFHRPRILDETTFGIAS